MVSGPPDDDVAVPAAVLRVAAGRSVRAVWQNEKGGLTFAVGDCFVKWAPLESGFDLRGEAERMRWAGQFIAVPRVLEVDADGEAMWLVTTALPGESAVSPRWVVRPAVAVAALGRGLRALHDALPVEPCPFDWSAEMRLAEIGATSAPPPVDRLVVCHADACSPNTLLDDDGTVTGYVDLGRLGVADRWADLAVATWATQWNYGPGWEDTLLSAYGVDPDPVRTAYYRLLWDLGP